MASLTMPLNVAGFARDAPELWSSCGQGFVIVVVVLGSGDACHVEWISRYGPLIK